ncbi:MAG: 1-acyl-sn-glycerol-3-phosphate acyltransferase [Deltaproteobacteria bacterium]|nr:1-acyl-sn-glycerol-3-phosphate acyltransferase [Deltaproteobacteria bacterium]
MLYPLLRAVVAFALRSFYRLEVRPAAGAPVPVDGPVLFVGNHPNGMVDPALFFAVLPREVTFLAKSTLFSIPVLGAVMRALRALPVYRKQDDPSQMARNEGSLEAAAEALCAGRAITLFPEGKSHSEPQLAELKTGAARIAFRVARRGAQLRVVPVGLTYGEKQRFRSRAVVQFGAPVDVAAYVPATEAEEAAQVRALTERMAAELRAVTVNLEQWEDLPLVRLAEQLYALSLKEAPDDAERLGRFARGLALFRQEQPERFEQLRRRMVAFQRRLDLVQASPDQLSVQYRPWPVVRFVLKHAVLLGLGLPLYALGVVLFAAPYQLARAVIRRKEVELDLRATFKLLALLGLGPPWVALCAVAAGWAFGLPVGLAVALVSVPLAGFTGYFLGQVAEVRRDVAVFFALASRAKLKSGLLGEGALLQAEMEALAAEYRARVTAAR